MMPKATKEGYRILYGVLADTDPELYSPVDIFRHCQAICDLILRDEQEVCTPGLIVLFFGRNATMKHVMKWELSLMKAVSDMFTVSSMMIF